MTAYPENIFIGEFFHGCVGGIFHGWDTRKRRYLEEFFHGCNAIPRREIFHGFNKFPSPCVIYSMRGTA